MREFAESFNALVTKTGGVALLAAVPLIPCILLWGGLQAVGRSLWSAGTRRRHHAIARQILSRPRYPGDEFDREIAENALKY